MDITADYEHYVEQKSKQRRDKKGRKIVKKNDKSNINMPNSLFIVFFLALNGITFELLKTKNLYMFTYLL